MNPTHSLVACAGLALLGGCALPSVKALPADPQPRVVEQDTSNLERRPDYVVPKQPQAEPKLYARDGSIVGGQTPGTVAVTPNSGRGSAADGGSRWTLLEQYQTAVSKNEELDLELQALTQALEAAEAREAELAALVRELQGTLAASQARIEQMEGENIELASRLTTAQIRRLQSEKLLLEAKLDWKRVEVMVNSAEQSPGQPPSEGFDPSAGPSASRGPIGDQP